MKISIIIPTYNASKTLSAAIESILEQTFIDYEILIIDGLSTDHTVELAKSYQDERIKIISEKDSGIYDAMNKGIQLAEGEWLYFLGSDDYLLRPNTLAEVSQYLNHEYDLVYGNVVWGDTREIYDGPFTLEKVVKEKNICHQAIFHNKNIYIKMGLYDLTYKYCADHYFNIRCFIEKCNILYIDVLVAYYNINGLSSSGGDIEFQKKNKLILIELFENPIEVYSNHLKYQKLQSNILFRTLINIHKTIESLAKI